MVLPRKKDRWRIEKRQRQRNNKSFGVNPSIFHKPKNKNTSPACSFSSTDQQSLLELFHQKHMPEEVKNILLSASQRLNSRSCNEWYEKNIKTRRSAYREFSSLRTFPMQDLAITEYKEQLCIHFGSDTKSTSKPDDQRTDQSQQEKKQQQEDGSDVSDGILTSSCDSMKEDEFKRRKQKKESDASESTDKARYLREFEHERNLVKRNPKEKENCFLPALWSLEPRIFSVEVSKTGKRKYIVGSFGRFADMYWRKTSLSTRNYYELIREETPCRLYFDIEYCKISNPEISSNIIERCLDELFEELAFQFRCLYPELKPISRSCIVDLESSTSKKFSRHWIVHISNGSLFANAGHAGKFVRLLVGRLADDLGTGVLLKRSPALARHLFVATKNSGAGKACADDDNLTGDPSYGPSIEEESQNLPLHYPSSPNTTCLIDMGVYTRNRLFRLLGSSKYGKPSSAALRIAKANKFPFPNSFDNWKFYVPDIEKKYKDKNEKESDINLDAYMAAMDWSIHAQALADTLVVPLNSTKIDYPIFKDPSLVGGCENLTVFHGSSDANRRTKKCTDQTKTGTGTSSPFTLLDGHVTEVLGCRGGVQGKIRAWSMDLSFEKDSAQSSGVAGSISYQMSGNRYCENVRRHHKSNNIMWTLDFCTMRIHQSCHDPDCKAAGFFGEKLNIPKEVKSEIDEVLFDMELGQINEEELLQDAKSSKQSSVSETSIPPRKNWEFDKADESEFEQALLALDLNDIKNHASTAFVS